MFNQLLHNELPLHPATLVKVNPGPGGHQKPLIALVKNQTS